MKINKYNLIKQATPKQKPIIRLSSGFTLLELIVVVAILVAIAGIGTFAMRNIVSDSAIDVTRAEMQQISKAITQFKQDTGYYIGQGPFALLDSNDDGNADANCNACTLASCSSIGALDPASVTSQIWLENPVNFKQLFSEPVYCSNHPIKSVMASATFKANNRGWNGPYMVSSEGVVSLQTIPDSVLATGNLTPGNAIVNIPSLSDPFERADSSVFKFSWLASSAGSLANSAGSPYMLFIQKIDNSDVPRLVSAGRDGEYAGVNGGALPSLEQWCSPIPTSDDIVLCF
ncbi:MAG: prepilin-type N-terminal cleavage/methylation domain-containing protein [Alcanivoracaceae bacterium]|nr:prepilin-type N-terminal cleavage/methylation domain-containing protein [Alcanivoracaceae bacterium]